jgi:hypothetical protein
MGMKVKVKGKTYDVSAAAPGASHAVHLDGAPLGSFVIEPRDIKLAPAGGTSERLLLEIAETFIDLGGTPMGIA